MLLKVNDKNEILEFALIGSLNGSTIEVDDDLANETFVNEFEPQKFVYQNGSIESNANYTPIVPDDNNQPTPYQQALTDLAKQSGTNSEGISQLQEAVTALAQAQGGK
ncbi:DUF2977 domain-containing protein [Pediococcus pentosaceus]|uniref:DUF2977 domain-containing protein n=1 Tax=Pediococcus pentosaceus TaxID=1255 RepID=UPI001F593165|nr:DUF2977 domain-containing protein [Pediococcus pentosaceus]MCI2960353.1 DUF2977 domain-containing protein [Pediococcus pentosaceus]